MEEVQLQRRILQVNTFFSAIQSRGLLQAFGLISSVQQL